MRTPRSILAVTGSRNDYGLLRPVLRAIDAHPALRLLVAAAGGHLLAPFNTIEEVRGDFPIAAEIPMQRGGRSGRLDDAEALGRGVLGFAEALDQLQPDVVLVLGDRLEAFAAASAAAIGGIRVAHMHGGDRAEGVADELIRHATTKLAHIHFPATARSAERILCFGEDPLRVHLVGSPAVDGIDAIDPLDDAEYAALGSPELLFLLHGQGRPEAEERLDAEILIGICGRAGRTLLLHPNHDPGHDAIVAAIVAAGLPNAAHLPRERFIGLLKRVRALVGNSSSALIECAALGVRCVNVGPRQAGREKPPNVIDVPDWNARKIEFAVERALLAPPPPYRHPYGDGRCGEKTAAVLANFDPGIHSLTKRATF
ncbi:MAG TPA: UDP-N-acetylglucosamine 2-epimerase [Phycisphaerales bacterium]|nr:UDP-N-acetylglucosamine 2-epimerase [Phycisphaerales bacterium]HMP36166.1 UDP-N-acetylglucosamine 2-epimerase [Phycisphaerales bacterium]